MDGTDISQIEVGSTSVHQGPQSFSLPIPPSTKGGEYYVESSMPSLRKNITVLGVSRPSSTPNAVTFDQPQYEPDQLVTGVFILNELNAASLTPSYTKEDTILRPMPIEWEGIWTLTIDGEKKEEHAEFLKFKAEEKHPSFPFSFTLPPVIHDRHSVILTLQSSSSGLMESKTFVVPLLQVDALSISVLPEGGDWFPFLPTTLYVHVRDIPYPIP